MANHFDTIVIGLGAMGSAATYQLAKRGKRVLGIDRYAPPHAVGSTHGDTRITRQAIGEGEQYTPLVLRANELWREIERESGQELLSQVGGLIITDAENGGSAHGNTDFFTTTVSAANRYGIAYEEPDAAELAKRFPQFRWDGRQRAYYEPGAGFLRPERCVSAQLELARRHGAEIHTDEEVIEVCPLGGGVEVRTAQATYQAETAIICAGPWVRRFAPEKYQGLFKVYRQVLYWFDLAPEAYLAFLPERCPVYIWDYGMADNDGFYGFPAVDGPTGGIKVATEEYLVETAPDEVDRTVSAEETARTYELIAPHLNGVTSTCLRSATCLYTTTPDSGFVIDRLPDSPQVILASPCSGHGFKHSAAVGEALAELATEAKTTVDISSFGLGRFQFPHNE